MFSNSNLGMGRAGFFPAPAAPCGFWTEFFSLFCLLLCVYFMGYFSKARRPISYQFRDRLGRFFHVRAARVAGRIPAVGYFFGPRADFRITYVLRLTEGCSTLFSSANKISNFRFTIIILF